MLNKTPSDAHDFFLKTHRNRHLWLIVSVFLLCSATYAFKSEGPVRTAQVQAPSEDEALEQVSVPAERIIAILRQQPALLSEVKKTLMKQLHDQGSPVEEKQFTDTALFTKIQEDPRLRAALTKELVTRGYIDADEIDRSRDDSPPRLSTRRQSSTQNKRDRMGNEGKPRVSELSHIPSPYSKLPSLDDLYVQIPSEQEKLLRFGAGLFRQAELGGNTDDLPMDLPAGPDYVLGSGDGLNVTLTGGTSQSLRRTVDREGRIALPEVGAVLVTGKTISEARDLIEKALATQFQNTKVDLSLSRIRTVRVYVVGDVERPGPYDISSLSTPFNALIAAGGPTAQGSFRTVRHYRGKELVREVDLYDFMLKGVRSDVVRLQPGDTIVVPPIGSQVAVSGMVKRPAIYELRNEKDLTEVLDLAGGVLVTGTLGQINVERVEAHQQRVMLSLKLPDAPTKEALNQAIGQFQVQDGDKIMISSILPYANQAVYLDGHVFRPGKYPYSKGLKITDLIHSYEDLLPEPADHAEVIRLMQPDWRPVVIEFSLGNALAGDEPLALQPFDTVRIFGRYEIDAPHVAIVGEVLRPGEYPLASGTTAGGLLRLAGGLKRSAALDHAELASYVVENGKKVSVAHRTVEIGKIMAGDASADVILKPGDVLSIQQLTGWNDIGGTITVKGEVEHPGSFGIGDREKLSSLLRRVGGFRPGAYPAGAVLEREQVRDLDLKARTALIKRLESTQPTVKGQGNEQAALTQAFMQQQQQIVARLKSQPPTGRLVIKISPDISKWENTSADIELRAGDVLTIPKRPAFVLVNGQVNNSSAVTFTPGKNANWYLQRAGGITEFGNKGQIFVVRADGSVVGNGGSNWFTGSVLSTVMQPGDTVVVPEKIITESTFWKNLLNTAQITSSIAIAARVATSF